MLNKSKFLIKRFLSSSAIKTTHPPPFNYHQFFPFQSHPTKPFRSLINSSLTSPSFINWHRNKYKDDLDLLKKDLSQEELQLFDKYTTSNDLQAFSSEEIIFIVSALQHLSSASQKQGNINKTYSYLTEAEEICQKLNIKNTIEVANGHFMRARFSLVDDQDLNEVEKHLDEAERIWWLFDDEKEVQNLLVQIDIYRALLYKKRNENDKALDFLNSASKKADDIEDRDLLKIFVAVYQEMAYIYAARMDVDKTKECLSKGLKIAIDQFGEYSQQTFKFSWDLSSFYCNTQKDQEALCYAKKSLQIALKIFANDSAEVAQCYYSLGSLYLSNKQTDKALESLEEAIKIYEKLPQEYSMVLSDLYYHTSDFYHLQGKTQEAFTLLMKSNEMLTLENDSEIIETYLKRADLLKCFKRWSESQDYLFKALHVCQDLKQPLSKLRIVDINFLFGETYYGKEDWNTALKFFQDTEELLKECSGESLTEYLLFSYLGVLYTINKDYDKGVYYLEKAAHSCEMVGDIGFLISLYYCLEKVYTRQGMKKEREEVVEKFRKYEDLDQKRPDIQASLQKAERITWKIISLEMENQL